jgi:6-pyruvoyltetrahydropterin/6-carboxytetrahydropterin synthase
VIVEGKVDEAKGYLVDYGEVGAACDPIVQQLDHYYLNEIDGLSNPTAENIARWIWQRVKPKLPLLTEIVLRETCTTACVYRGA